MGSGNRLAVRRVSDEGGVIDNGVKVRLVRGIHGMKIAVEAFVFLVKTHQILGKISSYTKLRAALMDSHLFTVIIFYITVLKMRDVTACQKQGTVDLVQKPDPPLVGGVQIPVQRVLVDLFGVGALGNILGKDKFLVRVFFKKGVDCRIGSYRILKPLQDHKSIKRRPCMGKSGAKQKYRCLNGRISAPIYGYARRQMYMGVFLQCLRKRSYIAFPVHMNKRLIAGAVGNFVGKTLDVIRVCVA